MIDFVISVRDRERWRIQQCVNHLQSDMTGIIYVIDYGSKKPIKNIKGAEIIRVGNPTDTWNKSHALNIGIKKCKSPYIATTDCDMIIPQEFFKKIRTYIVTYYSNNVPIFREEDLFIYSTNVRRVKSRKGTFKQKWNWSIRWWKKNKRYPIKSDGGVQLFSKKWIWKVKGYDENFTYWDGMDNDIHLRALLDHIPVIDLGVQLLHQEHKKDKEEHLTQKEQSIALRMRAIKKQYLIDKEENKIIKNKGWAGEKPRINIKNLKLIKLKKKLKKEQKNIIDHLKKNKIKKKDLQKELIKLCGENTGIKVIWPRKRKK